jgi:hypothetical protein
MSLRRTSSNRSNSKRSSSNRSSSKRSSSGRPRIPAPPPPPPVRSSIKPKKETPEKGVKLYKGPTITYTSGSTFAKNTPNFLIDLKKNKVYTYDDLQGMSKKEINDIETKNRAYEAEINVMRKQTRGGRRQRKTKRTRRHKRS